MSKRKNDRPDRNASAAERSKVNSKDEPSSSAGPLSVLRRNLWMVAIIAFLCLGALGGTLKYLGSAPAAAAVTASAPSSLRPHPPSLPTGPPQLSKEYIHAGPRLLAVEDANAAAAPPADLAVWRPSNGTFYVLGSAGSYQVQWGVSTDRPALGDYDGDGKTDFSVFRPSTAQWYIVNNGDNSWTIWTFGDPNSSDKPAPADYDGDGRTDRAIFRPSNSTCYIVRSGDNVYYTRQFGTAGDIPAPADHDGDGKADLAVWRGTNTTFYSIDSGDESFQVIPFANSGTEPVSGDYDGDGKADYAVKSGSSWVIRKSSNGQTDIIPWQQAADKPVQNDFDADGKVDIAVWRESNGQWFIRQSGIGNSLRHVTWGQPGDTPVPAFYRR